MTIRIITKGIRNEGIDDIDGNILPDDHSLNIRGLVYEAFVMREKILEIETKAKELKRELVVIGNLSYGGVSLAPITEERNGSGSYIVGTDIPVWYTKVGSTESHHNEYVLVDNLLTPEQIKVLARKNPMVVVVDGSNSVANSARTSAHIPDGFKGYRNFFIVLNQVLYGHVSPEDFHEDEEFVDHLLDTPAAQALIRRIQETNIKLPASGKEYQFRFWYKRNAHPESNRDEFLYLRVNKKRDIIAPKADVSELAGPACVFMQSAIHPEDIDAVVNSEFIRGFHSPAFFDDKDQFKQFYLDYEEGYGVVLSKKYTYIARNIFKEFMRQQGRILTARISTVGNTRQIETVVIDLDNTFLDTDAKLDKEGAGLIRNISQEGKKFVIITDDKEDNLDARLKIASKASEFIVFSDGGAKGYSYDGVGNKVYFDEYNARGRIDIELRQKILDVIAFNFKAGSWQLEDRDVRISSDYRIDLRHVSDRNNFIKKLQGLLDGAGIKAKVYKAGRSSVRITLQHKEDAIRYFVDRYGIDTSKMLIIADSARSYGIDRGLLIALPEALSVNVGSFSPTIAKENPNIVQYDRGGVNACRKLLTNVQIYGELFEYLITPSSKGLPSDEKAYEDSFIANPAAASPIVSSNESKVNIASSSINKITPGSTSLGRNVDIDGFIKAWIDAKRENREFLVVDFGIGFPPVTPVELAKTLSGKARVIGVDTNIPYYVITFKEKEETFLAFFDDKHHLSFLVQKTKDFFDMYGYNLILDSSKKTLIESMAIEIRDDLMKKLTGRQKDLKEEDGEILFHPIERFIAGQSNFSVIKGGFNFSVEGQVDIIRAVNVFMYYDPVSSQKAMQLLGERLKEGGILIIGKNDQFIVFNKDNGQLFPYEVVENFKYVNTYSKHAGDQFVELVKRSYGTYDLFNKELRQSFPQFDHRIKILNDEISSIIFGFSNWAELAEKAKIENKTIDVYILSRAARQLNRKRCGAYLDVNNFIHFPLQESLHVSSGVRQNTDIENKQDGFSPGGIDFTAMPTMVSPVMGLQDNLKNNLGQIVSSSLKNIKLDNDDSPEWLQIQKMVHAGIIPSSQRIKEYLVSSCVRGEFNQEMDKVICCISGIFRLEEERLNPADSGMCEILRAIESCKTGLELQAAFNSFQ